MSVASRGWGGHHGTTALLPDVSDVHRPIGDYVTARISEAVHELGLMVLTGRVGMGKTFAVASACETLGPALDVDVVHLELAASARGKQLLTSLTRQICGAAPPASVNGDDLRFELTHELAQKRRLLVVDEAQHATNDALLTLRWLSDNPTTRFALVIIGLPSLRTKLPPELRSRATSMVQMSGLASDEVVGVLHAYHPLFTTAADEDLISYNRRYAAGEFRWWAKALARADRYVPHLGGTLSTVALERVAQDLTSGAGK